MQKMFSLVDILQIGCLKCQVINLAPQSGYCLEGWPHPQKQVFTRPEDLVPNESLLVIDSPGQKARRNGNLCLSMISATWHKCWVVFICISHQDLKQVWIRRGGGFTQTETCILLVIGSSGSKARCKWVNAFHWFNKCNVNQCLSLIHEAKNAKCKQNIIHNLDIVSSISVHFIFTFFSNTVNL